jgi:hypothetical protein
MGDDRITREQRKTVRADFERRLREGLVSMCEAAALAFWDAAEAEVESLRAAAELANRWDEEAAEKEGLVAWTEPSRTASRADGIAKTCRAHAAALRSALSGAPAAPPSTEHQGGDALAPDVEARSGGDAATTGEVTEGAASPAAEEDGLREALHEAQQGLEFARACLGARKPPPPATFEARKAALDNYIANARAALARAEGPETAPGKVKP